MNNSKGGLIKAMHLDKNNPRDNWELKWD